MAGSWTPVANSAPGAVNTMLLLSDGTVMGADGGRNWYRLTPGSSGGYTNGTWSTLAAMHDTRLYYSSQVLTDGRVFIAGGEYGTGTNTAEVYDPLSNSWTVAPTLLGGRFLDSISEILPNGNVLVAPVFGVPFGATLIYNPALNSFVTGPTDVRNNYQDEASWVKLPDDSILTIDPFGSTSERYIPALNKWLVDATVPVSLYASDSELGAALLLPNGKAFFLGATSKSAIYTPSGSTNAGSWAAGADIPNGLGAPDAPAAMMANGNILCVFNAAGTFNSPSSFYEYDYEANAFTSITAPDGANYAAYETRMLDLPDGTVLFSNGGTHLYVYTPDGPPLAQGQPTVASISTNSDGSYHLTGTQLNGISEGAGYGDDAQMNSNYPIIRMTNGSAAFYARTFNWSSTSVMTSNQLITTEFTVPAAVPYGDYTLFVTANGISSDPVAFTHGPPSPVTIPLTNSDAVGSSSFNSSLNWSNGLAPDTRNNYLVSGFELRTPQTNSDLRFSGGSMFITNGGALRLRGTGTTNIVTIGAPSGRALVLGGGVVSDLSGLPQALAGYVSLYGASNVFDPQSTTFVLASAVSGPGSLTIDSPNGVVGGTVSVVHTNTYSGGTFINANDTLLLSGAGTLGSSSNSLWLSNTLAHGFGGLDLNGTTQTVGSLFGSGGTITNRSTNISMLTVGVGNTAVGSANGSGSFAGRMVSSSTRPLGLTKAGAGTLVLSSNCTLKSLTIGLNNGTSVVTNGTLAATNGVSVSIGHGTNDLIAIASGSFSAATFGALNLSNASSFTANLGTIQVGQNLRNTSSSFPWTGSLILATNNTITASTSFVLGDATNALNAASIQALLSTPANSTTTINTPLLVLGGRKANPTCIFGTNSVFKIGATTNRAALLVGGAPQPGQINTSSSFTSAVNLSPATCIATLKSLAIGTLDNAGNGSETGSLILGTSTSNHLDVTGPGPTVVIGQNQPSGALNSVNTATGSLTISNLDAASVVTASDNGTAILLGNTTVNTSGTFNRAFGTLNLYGGTLTITTTGNGISGGSGNPNNTSTLNLNGVTLRAGADSTSFITGLSTATINAAGVTIDTANHNITIAQSLGGAGGLNKTGAGTLTLSQPNSYSGSTIVKAGILALAGPGSLPSSSIILSNGTTIDVTARADQSLNLNAGQNLQGAGTISGDLNAQAGSVILPGNGLGTIAVTGDATLAGSVIMEINRTNAVANDSILCSGLFTAGGMLTISNLGPALQPGDSFQLFNQPASGFTNVSLPDPSPYVWDNRLAMDGSIAIVVPVATTPASMNVQVASGALTISWPADHVGWHLQVQTNSLDTSGWVDLSGTGSTNVFLAPISDAEESVFYRLTYP